MQEIKNRIIMCAHIIFLKYGIKWIDLDYVASDCGISRKTLNQYFNRNKLVDVLIKSKIESYYLSLSAIERELLCTQEEMIKILAFSKILSYDFSAVFIRDLKRYYPDNWFLIERFIKGPLKDTVVGNLTAGISEGIYRKDIDVQLLGDVYFSTFFMMIESISAQLDVSEQGKRIEEMNKNFSAGLLVHN